MVCRVRRVRSLDPVSGVTGKRQCGGAIRRLQTKADAVHNDWAVTARQFPPTETLQGRSVFRDDAGTSDSALAQRIASSYYLPLVVLTRSAGKPERWCFRTAEVTSARPPCQIQWWERVIPRLFSVRPDQPPQACALA